MKITKGESPTGSGYTKVQKYLGGTRKYVKVHGSTQRYTEVLENTWKSSGMNKLL